MHILRQVFATMLALLAFSACAQSTGSSSKLENESQLRRIKDLEEKQKELLNKLNAQRKERGEPPLSLEEGQTGQEESPVYVIGGVARKIISPKTNGLDEANFYAMVREKVEKEGTCHFPSKGRKKLYGNVVISIPISENGAIHQKTGGAKIERSSGNQYLDAAALRIVNSSAPFGPIPESQRKAGYENVWTVVAYFDFKRVEEDDSPIDCAK